jgi:hypothetical protein
MRKRARSKAGEGERREPESRRDSSRPPSKRVLDDLVIYCPKCDEREFSDRDT